jgi:hypothetical protein
MGQVEVPMPSNAAPVPSLPTLTVLGVVCTQDLPHTYRGRVGQLLLLVEDDEGACMCSLSSGVDADELACGYGETVEAAAEQAERLLREHAQRAQHALADLCDARNRAALVANIAEMEGHLASGALTESERPIAEQEIAYARGVLAEVAS